MKFIGPALLLLLPALSAAQTEGLSPMCANFRLDVTGITFTWANWVGGNNIVANTNPGEIRWGTGANSNGDKSGLKADTTGVYFPLSLPINDEFVIGRLTHLNYPIYAGGAVHELDLEVTVHTSEGDFMFTYDLEVDETPNVSGSCEHYSTAPCADQILIINDPTPQTFQTMDGKEFEIDLIGFRDSLMPGAETTTEFISQEGGESSAYLYGSLYLTGCPRSGGGMGDPHFQTWTGHWYDFHGGCDLHLVNAPHFSEESPLTVDVRTRTRDWYSFIETAAIKVGNDVLEVSGYGSYFLNGVEGTPLGVKTMADKYAITHEQRDEKTHKFTVEIEGSEKVVIKTFKDLVSVTIENADINRFKDSTGMMGDFQTGEVYARGGKRVILEDPALIAREWQVRNDEPMLFQSAQGPQYPEVCVMPKKQEPKGRLGRTVAMSAAEKACAHWTADTRDMCIQDVIKTGDVEIAVAM